MREFKNLEVSPPLVKSAELTRMATVQVIKGDIILVGVRGGSE